ncbi:SDR family oxidoreductase [Psychrobacter sp. P2G3]|uniref:SDR family NAD(P)-dependent oxidoreductase n=1 Tax=Psychrobacter sp. P2G3 TaxID=1699622 RepID=UPI00078E34CD|nr:SDR family oxidoreductase [Psychrobacter sp. P2G3]AMN48595.1 3-oxoacyl-ACP reductase [Psychrobacter sp. P2G3]
MNDKTVVVTGGTKGLGLAIVDRLSEEGYTVVAIGRTLSEDLEKLIQVSSNIKFISYDFCNTDNIKSLAKDINKKYGRIYGLVNNAALGNDGILATMHETDIEEMLKVNIQAPILLTKYLVRSMLLNQEGRIVNISSIIASTGFNGLSVYAASKAALAGFTKSLSREVGKANITVNTVSPGYMKTKMTEGLEGDKLKSIVRRSPLGRLASVEDVSDVVSFLLKDSSKSITGSNITVDAGSTA